MTAPKRARDTGKVDTAKSGGGKADTGKSGNGKADTGKPHAVSAISDSDTAESEIAKAHAEPVSTELGKITFNDRVVAKIAASAAVEVADAGGAAPRLMGKSLSAAGALGGRRTSLDALPKASARVDGSLALIDLSISVRWPMSVPEVTAAVRDRVRQQVGALTGLAVPEVNITVTDLVTHLAPPPRVH